MRFWHWIVHEAKSILTAMLFFLALFAVIVVLKDLMVEQYDITVGTSVKVVMLAFVTAKVVVLFERASFGRNIGLVEVLLRSAIYSFAAFLILLLEHGISERKEAGGFPAAVTSAFRHPDMPIIWATLICVTLSFLVWNALAVLRREVGRERLVEVFLRPPAAEPRPVARH